MRARAAALVPGAFLAIFLCAGEARAAAVCSDAPGATDTIRCQVASGTTANVDINAASVTITAPIGTPAIHGEIDGTGSIEIDVTDSDLTGGDWSHGVFARHDGAGSIRVSVTDTAVKAANTPVYGYRARGFGGRIQTGSLAVRVSGGSVTQTGGFNYGVRGQQAGRGDVSVHLANGVVVKSSGSGARIDGGYGDALFRMEGGSSIETSGDFGYGVYFGSLEGDIEMDARDGSVTTTGDYAYGLNINHFRLSGRPASTLIGMKDFRVSTSGARATGVRAVTDGIVFDLEDVSVTTKGEEARGFHIRGYTSGSGRAVLRFRGGAVSTEGDDATAVYIDVSRLDAGDPGAGDDAGGIAGVDIRTKGRASHGVHARLYFRNGEGSIFLDFRDGAVSTEGDGAHGVFADYSTPGGGLRVETKTFVSLRAAAVSTEGLGAVGAYVRHVDAGSASVTIDAESAIKTPFGVGAEARLENKAAPNARREIAADGIRIEHAGEIEARAVGVLARVELSSGSTFAEEADEAEGEGEEAADPPQERTEPILHVETSGDITVGVGVMDDFIRARVAGEDGTLSTGERAVLDAVTAGDSDALDTALAALPAAYDDDWKAQARELLRKRGHEPTGNFAAAEAEAGGILGLSRAGVRAVAQEHRALARRVAEGDVDPNLVPPRRYWPPLSDEERETLAAQQALTAAERAVLAAALTGGDLEGALAALPEGYADAWKNDVRRLAASYNAGDIRVDVTGGTIAAEGNGVEALYAVPHERNGGIAVRVAEGASVSGGANGLYLSGAGAGAGNFLAQSVSIDGRVAGGAGAGVYMKGGGRLAVGAAGRISAASGVGVLADGSGDFHATVAGRVEGDLRGEVAGDFTAIISGLVEGDVEGLGSGDHTVNVAPGGGVAGNIHSEVAGDFTAIISGLVEGDVEGLGAGDHTVAVSEGGEVAGTIHLAASAVRLDGSAGRVRFDRGGTLALGAAGRLSGVDGIAVESLGDAASRLRLGLRLPPTRRVREAIGDGWIRNERGGTDILVNGLRLHDAERGATGVVATIGARNVAVRPSGTILGRNFSSADFIDVFAPRAGLYEALPGLLARLAAGGAGGAGGAGSGPGGRGGLFSPDAPVWVRLSGARSSGSGGSTVGGKREFDRFEAEAGGEVFLPWTRGLSAWGLIRLSEGSARVSTPGDRGKMEVEGLGLGAGGSWRSAGGWYVSGGLLATEYLADFSSKGMGALKSDAGAIVRSLEMEAGRRAAFRSARLSFTPRAWLARSRLSMDDFTDATGARFSLVRGDRLTGGVGVLAEAADPLDVGGGRLALRGSADVEEILSGERTTVEVSGERLHARAEKTRLLLGMGARWRAGCFSLDADLSASGLGSGEKTYGGRLSLGVRF